MKIEGKKGISLIVLVITILVMIILAGVIIVSLQNDNPINKAKEAVDKTDIIAYKDELNLNILNKFIRDNKLKKEDINETEWDKIKEYIPSMKKEHKGRFIIEKGELVEKGGLNPDNPGNTEATEKVNAPVLDKGMIPIKFKEGKWIICDSKDIEWYDYSEKNKQWANVMLSDGTYKAGDSSNIDKVVEDKDLGSMFVWIPRFAYSINEYKTNKYQKDTEGKTQKIHDITFLNGTTNKDFSGKQEFQDKYNLEEYEGSKKGQKTPKIVHPAFKLGDKLLEGIWVAKFETSMNENGTGHKNTFNYNCNFLDNSYSMIKILPNIEPWEYIEIDKAFLYCLNMKTPKEKEGNKNIYGLEKSDSHLIKNIEWGAVSYLTTSKYGFTPKINGTSAWIDKQYTGGKDYRKNIEQSTTGNITGIYDMNGGTEEFVAAYSEDIGSYYGNEVIKPQYDKYFDKYKVNFNKMQDKYGDACFEVLEEKDGNVTLYNEDQYSFNNKFLIRSQLSYLGQLAGIFALNNEMGGERENLSFRPVLAI